MSKPRGKYSTRPPPPPSLSSLLEEIVLRCLALVPRSNHLSLSWVSKDLRASLSLLNGLRSIRHKSSLYICFRNRYNDPNWFILRPTDETSATATTEYRLVPNPWELAGTEKDTAYVVCVVEDVLFAFFNRSGIMWFDTKLSVWRRLLGSDGKQLPIQRRKACGFVHVGAGDMICGTVDWSGVVCTVTYSFGFLHCLAVSE
ncbi:hypothetical protein N665_0266s0054 [Sinapis alba]|nr:hypothetical protein N665_0266s0054 [Sinapis alba]